MSIIVSLFCLGICIVYTVVISSNITDLLDDQVSWRTLSLGGDAVVLPASPHTSMPAQGWITGPIFPGGFGEVFDNRR